MPATYLLDDVQETLLLVNWDYFIKKELLVKLAIIRKIPPLFKSSHISEVGNKICSQGFFTRFRQTFPFNFKSKTAFDLRHELLHSRSNLNV